VQGLETVYPQIRALGGEILLIGPETEEHAVEMMEKGRATIPLLRDTDGAVMERYRLAFDAPAEYQALYREMGHPIVQANAGTGFRLPIPATFVVASHGRIHARYVNADYATRMEPADVLAAVRSAVN
jgi:peroxiredoxin